jgi:hypothetical protein
MHDDCSSKISQSLTIACRVLGPLQQTELCKTLAACYYGSEKDMIRIDMSEYMEKHVRIIIAIWSTVESQCVDLNTDSCLFVVLIFSLVFSRPFRDWYVRATRKNICLGDDAPRHVRTNVCFFGVHCVVHRPDLLLAT